MIFEYQAISHSGAMVADTLTVDDRSEAYAELTRRGLTPLRIRERSEAAAVKGPLAFLRQGDNAGMVGEPRRASRKELPFFTSQLAIMLETGTPVAPSLLALKQQVTCPHWRELIGQLHRFVEEGGTLAAAMAQYATVFDPVYVAMISAGEASGKLSKILGRLASVSRQGARIRGKIISAMIYPSLLTVIAFSVVMVLIFFVLPRFSAVFEDMKVDLPGSTRALLAISSFVLNHAVLSLVIVVGLIAGVVWWLRSQVGRRMIASAQVRLPIVGPLYISLTNARIFRLLGLLLESSVSLLEALGLIRVAMRHEQYAQLMQRIYDNVLNGRSIHEVLMRSPLVMPSMAQMIHTGEDNGRVGMVMTMLADYLDDQNETKVSMLTSIMEPIILIFMGLVIGTVAMALVLPLFDLSRISS